MLTRETAATMPCSPVSVSPALHGVLQVVPTEFRLQFEDRPGGDIVYALTDKGKASDLKSKPFVLKEGCSYRLQVTFKTQHEIVTGLKFVNTVPLLAPALCFTDLLFSSCAGAVDPVAAGV
jgi:hypothetical protein